MSLKTWMDEFYPITAEEVASEGTPLEIAQHSLTKWTGVRPENLEHHGLTRKGSRIYDTLNDRWDKPFIILDDESCSLCVRHYQGDDGCTGCPIQLRTGRTCHDKYYAAIRQDYQTVEPMIELLTKTVEFVKIQSIK